jgi:protein tyrosine phosphatase
LFCFVFLGDVYFSEYRKDEQTRVKLLKEKHEEGTDYINANFVGCEGQYIAAQAPTPPAFGDFWRMVYERNVQVIVMLTREFEGKKVTHPSCRKQRLFQG